MWRKVSLFGNLLFMVFVMCLGAPDIADATDRNSIEPGTDFPLQQGGTQTQVSIAEEARHKLLTLPYYGVFDWLDGQVNPDGSVVLRGQVVRPTTKSDAEARVKRIPGVTRVDNQIEVLPLSPNDDRLRAQIYRTIFNHNSPLFRYGTMAVPPIHIIVKNGRATLKGVVDNKGDANLAYVRTRGVPGLFDVSNELTVGSPDAEAR
jgi:hyperosmotically inducible periplasmic protein